MRVNRMFLLFLLIGMVWSCKKDDGTGLVAIPPRALDEVAAEDDASIKEFLETHFYNYEEFDNPSAEFDFRIKIDTIAGANADKIALINQAQTGSVTVSSEEFGIDGNESVVHTYYYIIARSGIGVSPTVADSAFVKYEGSLLNGRIFDGSTQTPVWFDLARIQAPLQGTRGFTEAMSKFKTGGQPIINNDGTFSVDGSGIGLMIFPSGLGYFNTSQAIIPAYSPLVFKIDLYAYNETDHDRDGIPSILEDLDGDGYLFNDNTDRDDEIKARTNQSPNYLDADDDGDGTPTREEIIIDAEGNITFPDTDGDGIPDYLDKDTK